MDAKEFIRQRNRMCRNYTAGGGCADCPAQQQICFYLADAEKDDCFIVTIVERWANEHPAVTRKSKMLEMFPNVTMLSNGGVDICPGQLETNYECQGDCFECQKEYWESEA